MTRRCSHCNSNGHSTRSCSTRSGGGGGGLRLFGVRLTDGSFIKKSASMGNLSHYSASSDSPEGYHSDEPDHGFAARRRPIRKKGTPWTEEEHRQFLLGLQKLGKGDWRGISKNYVPSRTPTQVASHAQKYFIRQSSVPKKKKRPSLFDIVPNMETSSSGEQLNFPPQAIGMDNEKITLSSSRKADLDNSLPSLDLSLKPAFMLLPFQLWPPNAYSLGDEVATSYHHNVKTVAAAPDEPLKDLVGMSQLTLGETSPVKVESSPFSLMLSGKP
ncbi:hypothetical protein CDL12_01206 [Handroanthus impetiginosus]|uniref:Uncharacterized protein n=1 Tax=Handroanthus impetiginosus TaxID=429701 RepID=A0A2G9I8G1_9LAMI|nr:hypothetical protein CDL12_01206 [Handroanthus impetiginosus]